MKKFRADEKESDWYFPDDLLGELEETTIMDIIDSGGINMDRQYYFKLNKFKEDYYYEY